MNPIMKLKLIRSAVLIVLVSSFIFTVSCKEEDTPRSMTEAAIIAELQANEAVLGRALEEVSKLITSEKMDALNQEAITGADFKSRFMEEVEELFLHSISLAESPDGARITIGDIIGIGEFLDTNQFGKMDEELISIFDDEDMVHHLAAYSSSINDMLNARINTSGVDRWIEVINILDDNGEVDPGNLSECTFSVNIDGLMNFLGTDGIDVLRGGAGNDTLLGNRGTESKDIDQLAIAFDIPPGVVGLLLPAIQKISGGNESYSMWMREIIAPQLGNKFDSEGDLIAYINTAGLLGAVHMGLEKGTFDDQREASAFFLAARYRASMWFIANMLSE